MSLSFFVVVVVVVVVGAGIPAVVPHALGLSHHFAHPLIGGRFRTDVSEFFPDVHSQIVFRGRLWLHPLGSRLSKGHDDPGGWRDYLEGLAERNPSLLAGQGNLRLVHPQSSRGFQELLHANVSTGIILQQLQAGPKISPKEPVPDGHYHGCADVPEKVFLVGTGKHAVPQSDRVRQEKLPGQQRGEPPNGVIARAQIEV
mmetsp:Transcript_20714/g.48736  ORF Transcript_20714/g.48736 Transcript_20714/m.48736 type:complete len:200 (-) Transcript_20714:925-1524(-)